MVRNLEQRDILFGIWAARHALVSIETLHDTLSHCFSDESSVFSDVLTRKGMLTKEQVEFVDAQVRSQMAQLVTGQATQSLPRSGEAPKERRRPAVTVEADITLRETIGRTSTAGRFRVLRPHARGGLGEVFVALDEELDREVALKQIQLEFAENAEQRDRFLREAEITGKLEHPGIVPVYGLGHDFLDDYQREQLVPEIKNRILIFSSVPRIREDIEVASSLPDELAARAMYDCAAWLITDGKHERAFEILQRMERMDNVTGRDFYQNACGYAKCAKAVLNDRQVDELSETELQLIEKYRKLAIATLYKSKAGGFFSDAVVLGLLGRDQDMDGLRERDDFKAFMDEVQQELNSN